MSSARVKTFERRRGIWSAVGILTVISLSLFISGVVFIFGKNCKEQPALVSPQSLKDACKHSEEARNSGFIDLLSKVRTANNDYNRISISNLLIPKRDYYKPETLKSTSDKSRDLYKQLKTLRIKRSELTSREQQSFTEMEHFLRHNFGAPQRDYYSGFWLLGPTMWCNEYICRSLAHDVFRTISSHNPPKRIQDLKKIRASLPYYGKTVNQYIENLRYGVKAGMVRPINVCRTGLEAMKSSYGKISELNATGVLKEWFARHIKGERYYSSLSETDKMKWFDKYGKHVNDSMRISVVKHIGRPIERLLRFLEEDYMNHCVPSNISSGLANLPLSHVYYKGVKTNKETVQILPTGEKLDGSAAYEMLLAYYTTLNLTADEVHDLGWKHVHILYQQILDLAKNTTGHKNLTIAVGKFRKKLTETKQFYNLKPFPSNESFAEAKNKCNNIERAKKFCPNRWNALQFWFDEQAKILGTIEPKLSKLFHYRGNKQTTPNCPVKIAPNFKVASGVPMYRASNSMCQWPATFFMPFFIDNYGPRYMEIVINAHESRPGHHTQLQGYKENFARDCSPDDISWLDSKTKYSAFSEGWGLYAEFPLAAKFTDAIENDPWSQYGVLKAQMWRSLRLVIDSGLHSKGMKQDEAMQLFDRYMWDSSDVMYKEVMRYQTIPGQSSSYKIGQLRFIELLEYAQEELGNKFDIRDFHYELLRHGSVPLDYITHVVKEYVACEKPNATCSEQKFKRHAPIKVGEKETNDDDLQQNYDLRNYF